MKTFMENYSKSIFVLVLIAILIAFAHPLGIKIKEYTTSKINQTDKIGTKEITIANGGTIKPEKPTETVDKVYCIYYTDGELVIAQNQIEPESGKTVEKQGFYNRPRDCTRWMTTVRFEGAVMPKSCEEWFYYCKYLTTIKNIKNLYTDECTNMSYMFGECSSLTAIDLSELNVENIENMSSMFHSCSSLTNLKIGKWNTIKCDNMSSMFHSCSSLTILDLTELNCENVKNMSGMFNSCENLQSINISKWNTSQVIYMSNMFNNCRNLINIDVSKWNTKNVKKMDYMFSNCNSFENLHIKNWDVSMVENMDSMFFNCNNLMSLDIKDWTVSNVYNLKYMFKKCSKLTLDCSSWDVSKVRYYVDFNLSARNVIAPNWIL